MRLGVSCTLLHGKYEYASNRKGSEMGDEAAQKPADASVRKSVLTIDIHLNPHAA